MLVLRFLTVAVRKGLVHGYAAGSGTAKTSLNE
jgi:hypothetical protein